MALPNFTVAANLFDIPGSVAGGELDELALAEIQVIFRSNLPADKFIVWDGGMYRPPVKVHAEVDTDGTIIRDGVPARLLANDPGLSVAGIQWSIQVLMPAAAGRAQAMRPWVFNALTDGDTLTLANTAPVPELPPIDITTYLLDGGPL